MHQIKSADAFTLLFGGVVDIGPGFDGAGINAAILESMKELNTWMPWARELPSIDDSELSVRRATAKWILREDLRVSLFSGPEDE